MKKILYAIFLALLVCSCSKEPVPSSFKENVCEVYDGYWYPSKSVRYVLVIENESPTYLIEYYNNTSVIVSISKDDCGYLGGNKFTETFLYKVLKEMRGGIDVDKHLFIYINGKYASIAPKAIAKKEVELFEIYLNLVE